METRKFESRSVTAAASPRIKLRPRSVSWFAVIALLSLPVTIALPVMTWMVGMRLGLGGATAGLATRDARRSHTDGRVATAGVAVLVGPAIHLALAAS